jgi:hypothetical protein
MVKTLYFLAIMLTSIAMGAALAHLFELTRSTSARRIISPCSATTIIGGSLA